MTHSSANANINTARTPAAKDTLWVAVAYMLTALLFLPVMRWLMEQTAREGQLSHAFVVLAFTGALLVIQRGLRFHFAFRFGPIEQSLLAAAYACVIASFLFPHALLILGALSLATTSFLLWLLGTQHRRMLIAVMLGFTAFMAFALLLPALDWPLRAIAGQCASAALQAIGTSTDLALHRSPEGIILLLFSNNRPFNVAAECNGFGLLSSAILMVIVVAIFLRAKPIPIFLSLAFAVALAIAVNALRITAIVLLAPQLPDSAYMLMHETIGIIATYSALGLLYFASTHWLAPHQSPAD